MVNIMHFQWPKDCQMQKIAYVCLTAVLNFLHLNLKAVVVCFYIIFVTVQGSKLTLVRWPVASGFPVGPVESVLHWPGWPVKF